MATVLGKCRRLTMSRGSDMSLYLVFMVQDTPPSHTLTGYMATKQSDDATNVIAMRGAATDVILNLISNVSI